MRNRLTFGIGTIGRDMVYSLISMFLIFYLTDVLDVPTGPFWWITLIIVACRVFDACNDPVMGLVVDNTRTRFGKFKPWIAFGAFASGAVTILLFTGFPLDGPGGVALFGVLYLLWGLAYTTNDIPFWSMLPSLSSDQKEREKIGSVARICANAGLFFVVAGIVPITTAWSKSGDAGGITQRAFLMFAVLAVAIMWAGQLVTLIGVRRPADAAAAGRGERTTPRELVGVIVKNDQLLCTAVCMALFMIGYITTTSFGIYFFKYAYGDEGMYAVFAAILGVSQIAALAVFPLFSKRFSRRNLYTAAIVLIVAGYLLFFFAPADSMLFVGPAGMLIFVGQAFVQLLMLVFLADSVEYGHWKLGRRNDSITFSLQPFINKMGGAVSSGIVGAVAVVSGIKDAESAADVTSGGVWLMKAAMLIFPLICIASSFLIYRSKYKIDAKLYEKIIAEISVREGANAE
ncbi:MAG: glycoside-pentoside-hexuronide (GPH):cation symporter [Defluviitaleaceae bacterium]|nr:glycoside-pentoside-hexuronide (GPH):cation symporter [Defluviitaleaceae bacterium]